MQENRSFDHYFGVMRGVRGFGDPHPATLPSGQPVWYPGRRRHGRRRRSAPTSRNLALTFIEDLDHSWDGTHQMFNGGNWDQWIPAKTTTAHGAHAARRTSRFTTRWPMRSPSATPTTARCSARPTPTATTCGPAGTATTARGGGPVIANDELGYDWQTYPERLQDAGVSWKIYQDAAAPASTPRTSGAGGRTRTSATTATTRCCTSSTTRTPPPGSPLYPARPHRDQRQQRRRLLRHPRCRRQERPAAERVLDRRPGGLHRAPGVARRLRRLVHRRACSTR